jgi:CubicO group peptidase (beta-lactamase class C family)
MPLDHYLRERIFKPLGTADTDLIRPERVRSRLATGYELRSGGAGEHGAILEPQTVATMFVPHYQPDPRIPGFGLGFFRANLGGHLVVERHRLHLRRSVGHGT